jgi:hypothetical protein
LTQFAPASLSPSPAESFDLLGILIDLMTDAPANAMQIAEPPFAAERVGLFTPVHPIPLAMGVSGRDLGGVLDLGGDLGSVLMSLSHLALHK